MTENMTNLASNAMVGTLDNQGFAYRGMEIFSIDQLMKRKFSEQSWLVEDWIPEGVISIAGRPKIGKSLMALDLALSIANGGYFLNRPCKKGKVLFLALEDHPRRIQSRLKQFDAKTTLDINFCFDFKYQTGSLLELEEVIRDNRINLVVMDTFSKFFPGVDQMDHVQMVDVLGSINKLTQALDISLIIIDHHRKQQLGSSNDPIEDLFGSTGKSSQVDTCLGLYKNGRENKYSLKLVSRDNPDIDLKLVLTPEDLRFRLIDDPNKIDPKTRKGKIVRAICDLHAKGEKATITAIATITKVEASNVSHDLKDLCVREIVRKGVKIGKEQPYEIVEK